MYIGGKGKIKKIVREHLKHQFLATKHIDTSWDEVLGESGNDVKEQLSLLIEQEEELSQITLKGLPKSSRTMNP